MKITITQGVGEGPTSLAAFDNALKDAGIANYNLIMLSSIIPTDSDLVIGKYKAGTNEFGNKLYVVLSRKYEDKLGKSAYSGLGWVQEMESRKGLFVEHNGETEEEVKDLITQTLTTMKTTRDDDMGGINYKISQIECKTMPVCSIVAAVFQSEGWGNA